MTQANNDVIGGYAKYLTDSPSANGDPLTVVFPQSGAMTIVSQGPFGSNVRIGPDGDRIHQKGQTLQANMTSIQRLAEIERPDRDVAQLLFASTDRPPRPIGALEMLLDADERNRADRFLAARDRQAFVASHGVLRLVLAAVLDLDPARLRILQQPGEKPRLEDGQPPLEFNLSHSGDVVMIGLATCDIGVDVEQIRALPELDDLIAQMLAPQEAAGLRAVSPDRRLDAFFACWTCKEAVTKALGRGLSMPLDTFAVATDPSVGPALLSLAGTSDPSGDWTLWSQSPEADYRAAAAVAAHGVTFEAHRLA